MVLYVVNVPNPPLGADWSTMVPGQYLWNVTGITATLTGIGPLRSPQVEVACGASGRLSFAGPGGHFDYDTLNGVVPFDNTWHMYGFVYDAGTQHGAVYQDGVLCPAALDVPGPAITAPIIDVGIGTDAGHGLGQTGVVDEFAYFDAALTAGDLAALFATAPNFAAWTAAVAALIPTTAYHLDGVAGDLPTDYSGNGHDGTYLHGGPTPNFAPGVFAGDNALALNTGAPLFRSSAAVASGDAASLAGDFTFVIWWRTTFSGAPFALLSASSAGEAGPGREVALSVSDGTHEVALLGSGFPAVPTPGPFAYTWLPTATSNAQTPNGKVTTIAIPPLILPAGYQLRSVTPDIGPADQWSQVAVWWDDNIQNAEQPLQPFEYPPGALLQYHQIGT